MTDDSPAGKPPPDVPAGDVPTRDSSTRDVSTRDVSTRDISAPDGPAGDVSGPDVSTGDHASARETARGDDFPVEGYAGDHAVRAEWDERYADRERLWSGQPNGALVAEVTGLPPGRALDVGCGEGADAIWLAARGWDVTALEVSGVALQRASEHARDAGAGGIRWVHAALDRAQLPPASFDLVSAQYPALLRTPGAASERALLAAVAPGGVLLLVHHAGMEEQSHDGAFDPADYVWPSMVAALLDDGWRVKVDERRPRVVPDGGAGAHHTDDVVLRARRLG